MQWTMSLLISVASLRWNSEVGNMFGLTYNTLRQHHYFIACCANIK
jgi:hypothetical protein